MVSIRAVVCLSLLALAGATNVSQCKSKPFDNLSEKVQLSPCENAPCNLIKGTDQNITIHFTPDNDMDDVTNKVSAILFGVPVPFVGVDGNSICDKIFTTDDQKAACPLKAGTEYIYKDSFPVYSLYPDIKTKVTWELVNDQTALICFKVPVQISKD